MAQPTIKAIRLIGVILSVLYLSACGSPTPTSTPTPDLNPFRTEVAATVLAQVAQTQAAMPTDTPQPSPTLTLEPTASPTLAASASSDPFITTTPGTPGTPPAGTLNRAAWVSQSIADGSVFEPGEPFTITWQLKNVGATTWTVSYLLRFYSGNAFGAPEEIQLGRVVPPESTVDISIPMTAPAQPGNYRTDWVLSDESRTNFKDPVFLQITVANPPTATFTPTATRAATATP
jgi:hypothetical protein